MNKIIIAAIAVVVGGQALFMSAPSAQALSCLSVDMYLDTVVKEDGGETLVFLGTATEVTKDHTQVVTVTKALKGWVAPKVWVEHDYSTDWQYFCSNGPAKKGESTVFLATVDSASGTFKVNQTLLASSVEAKDFIKALDKAKVEAGISEATPEDRKNEVMEQIKSLIAAIMNLMAEYRYWDGQTK